MYYSTYSVHVYTHTTWCTLQHTSCSVHFTSCYAKAAAFAMDTTPALSWERFATICRHTLQLTFCTDWSFLVQHQISIYLLCLVPTKTNSYFVKVIQQEWGTLLHSFTCCVLRILAVHTNVPADQNQTVSGFLGPHLGRLVHKWTSESQVAQLKGCRISVLQT